VGGHGPDQLAALKDPILFPALSDAQALAGLQEAVKGLAMTSHVEIQGLQILPSDSQAGLSRIGIRVRATADMDGTNGLLYAIETSKPLLYVDNLQLRPQMANNAPTAVLDLQFDVTAFRPGASS
jgi:general secretion pathway protein M